jgi:hypothetical protein
MSDLGEYFESLLVAFPSLRVFEIQTEDEYYIENRLPFIRSVTDRAPHLEYFALFDDEFDEYWKRVGGEWVSCNKIEFPSFAL